MKNEGDILAHYVPKKWVAGETINARIVDAMESEAFIDFMKNSWKNGDIYTKQYFLKEKYNVDEIYLFGSYARNEANQNSDLDFLVFGGRNFKLTMIFSLAEELRAILNKNVDVFEINEINQDSEFYKTIMKERLRVA